MDFDKIVTLVIVMVIWGASNAIRKIAKAAPKKPGSPAPEPGLLEILLGNLAAPRETGPGEKVVDLDAYLQAVPRPRATSSPTGPQTETTKDSRPPKPAATGRKAAPATTAVKAGKPRPVIPRRKPEMIVPTRRKLQDAVLWAEILAPPLALRDR